MILSILGKQPMSNFRRVVVTCPVCFWCIVVWLVGPSASFFFSSRIKATISLALGFLPSFRRSNTFFRANGGVVGADRAYNAVGAKSDTVSFNGSEPCCPHVALCGPFGHPEFDPEPCRELTVFNLFLNRKQICADLDQIVIHSFPDEVGCFLDESGYLWRELGIKGLCGFISAFLRLPWHFLVGSVTVTFSHENLSWRPS
jgi:hypothetical protein